MSDKIRSGKGSNIDASQNLADSTINSLGDNSFITDSVEGYKSDSENINIVGANNSISQFSDNAAGVVSQAVQSLENITSKNLQLYTDKNLLTENIGNGLDVADVKNFFKNPVVKWGSIGAGLLVLYISIRKK